jgi:hypothetical protein
VIPAVRFAGDERLLWVELTRSITPSGNVRYVRILAVISGSSSHGGDSPQAVTGREQLGFDPRADGRSR